MSSYPTYFSRAGPWFCRRFTWPWSLKCLWFFFFPSALRASSWKCWNFRCPIKGSADIDHFFMVSIACHICSKFGANNINYFSGSQANVWQPFFLSNEPVGFAKKKQNSAAKLATGSKLVVQLGPLYIIYNHFRKLFWIIDSGRFVAIWTSRMFRQSKFYFSFFMYTIFFSSRLDHVLYVTFHPIRLLHIPFYILVLYPFPNL